MLRLRILFVGRTKNGPDRDLADRYVERATLAGRALGLAVNVQEIAESGARRPEDRKAEEAGALLAALAAGTTRVVFDERGRPMTSAEFAALLRTARDTGIGLDFIVGGPDGLDPSLREAATHLVALGAMTWPHQLVRIMVAEQVYRAMTILAGHPYHRA